MLVGLDSKCEKIIECLLISNDRLTVQEVSNRIDINKRSIYYNICKINEWLENNNVEQIVVNGKGLQLNESQKNKIKELLKKIPNSIDYQFLPKERINIIIVSLVAKSGKIYVESLIEKCGVSRNSILSDLKIVENKLKEFNLTLNYNIKDGYFISGDVIKKGHYFS